MREKKQETSWAVEHALQRRLTFVREHEETTCDKKGRLVCQKRGGEKCCFQMSAKSGSMCDVAGSLINKKTNERRVFIYIIVACVARS
jgi:hypothetical protein